MRTFLTILICLGSAAAPGFASARMPPPNTLPVSAQQRSAAPPITQATETDRLQLVALYRQIAFLTGRCERHIPDAEGRVRRGLDNSRIDQASAWGADFTNSIIARFREGQADPAKNLQTLASCERDIMVAIGAVERRAIDRTIAAAEVEAKATCGGPVALDVARIDGDPADYGSDPLDYECLPR